MMAMHFRPGGCVRFVAGRGALLCCTVCMFFGALLVVSAAQGQVIEEGGFPVKGNGVSGEPFSLSCPERLVVAAGESVLLSCAATAVPEEGVRYEWESLSGDGLRLLSDANELSPLFTAPVPGESAEYVYRLTAMSAGLYETATVTVVVEGFPEGGDRSRGESSTGSGACDRFAFIEGERAGCSSKDEGSQPFSPFEGGFEGEEGLGLLFPEAPGLPGLPSGPVRGGGSGRQTPPRLECPAAVFLEELETGLVECHAWDALGEEYLEYSWEPVGNTTRDYMDNPRLIPEDAPNPSVVAPEAPVYDTLESFRSGETTFRYRYRLTATSRATGLSSSSEVEVFVSSSRPSVYCPLEVVVEEGSTVALDCDGVDPLSGRMDYDEDGASIEWEWEGLWGTSLAPLAATDLSSPLFTAPLGSAGEEYHYIATMTSSASGVPRTARRRVTVRVTGAEEGTQAVADASALEYKGSVPAITCTDAEIYEATADFTLDCSVTDEPPGATYLWTARGSTSDTDDLSSTTVLKPTFSVPDDIDETGGADKDYEYTVTMMAGGVEQASAYITVTVLEKPNIGCTRWNSSFNSLDGSLSPGGTFRFNTCLGEFGGAPSGSEYVFTWSGVSTECCTPEIALAHLSRTDIEDPVFTAPTASPYDGYLFFTYTLTVSAENADPITISPIGASVETQQRPQLSITCSDAEVYEGAANFTLDCEAAGRWSDGFAYTWQWSPTDNLTGSDTGTPTFSVPGSVDSDTTYTYTVSVSAQNHLSATETVEVTVRDTNPSITCSDAEVYEATAYFTLDCSVTNEPTGATYAWTARGSTANTDDLSSTTILKPTFDVPDDLDADTDYEYTVTLSASGIDDASEDIIVTVRNRPPITVDCDGVYGLTYQGNFEVQEGDADITLNCWATGAPVGSVYAWSWSPIDRLTDHHTATPTFAVPDAVDQYTVYTYTVTATAANAEDGVANVIVRVYDTDSMDPSLTCTDSEVYEGLADITLDCSVTNEPSGATYSWTGTDIAARLSSTTILKPTFYVPGVDTDTDYDYTVTLSADGMDDVVEDVTVTVLSKPSITARCLGNPYEVNEGSENFVMNCAAVGAPGENPDYMYAWTVRDNTPDTALALLSGRDIAAPTFYVPGEVEGHQIYQYLVTVSAENAVDGLVEVTVRVHDTDSTDTSLTCTDSEVYEATADFTLDCSVTDEPTGATYAWTARGSTSGTNLLSSTTILKPTFYVPGVNADTDYDYTVTMSADGMDDVVEDVTVTVLNKPAVTATCLGNRYEVYEGSPNFVLDCVASGAPGVNPDYTYVWTARGGGDTSKLSSTIIANPTFYVPDALDETTTYEYLLTVSADNAEDATAELTVTVLNRAPLSVVCTYPGSIYEGSADFELDCSASGALSGSDYDYVWTARGSTANTDLLIAGTDGPTPTFAVPDEVESNETYSYTLTVSAANAEDATLDVVITVLNRGALSVVCVNPVSAHEGSADIAFDCSASGAPEGSDYTYAWTARDDTQDTSLLSATDVASPTFYVPDQIEEDETHEYRLTVSTSAGNIDAGTFDLTVNVYDSSDLDVVCTDRTVYEGSPPFRLQCTASGGPPGVLREWDWSPATHLTGPRIRIPVFTVPANVEGDMTFTYTATVTAGSMVATGELTVTVLNKEALALVCTDPGSVYEGSADITLSCTASGAPSGSNYTYAWTARGSTANTNLLTSGTDGPTPTFSVPDDVNDDETYEYLLTVSAANAEDASAEVTVMVLDRAPLAFVDDSISGRVYVFTVGEPITAILLPEATGGLFPYTYTLTPALPNGLGLDDPTRTISGTPLEVSPRTEYTWQATDANSESVSLAFFIEVAPAEEPASVPVAESSSELPEPSALGVTVSVSSLRFGVQSAETQASLDPMTDQLSTRVSGPYHAGRMTLSLDGSEALDENGEMDLSIELASPVALRRKGGVEAASIVLAPQWSLAESCEQLSSQTIGGLYTEVTLSEDACRLLRFGGELDLMDVLSGRYTGSLDIILRSGESEETHSVEVDVTVIPVQRVITIGPGGVRFSTSRELPAGLTEEQNLSIYPHVAFLTEEKPHGVFELSNPSLIPLEISVSTRFGYTEATENGREVVVEDASGSHLGDLSQVVDIRPGVLVLQPGEKGLVRYGVQEGALAAMADKGYAAFFDVVSEPRQYVRTDQMPEEVAGDRTARVTMRVPGVYVPGEGASQLRATLLSISYVGSFSATFLLETQDHPFAGEVVAYDGDGRELGRRETLVYTRSRVRIPLDRMPEEGTVFLRFAPRGSGRAPEPASIPWDAPRRDIGGAQDNDRATTSDPIAKNP